MLAKFLAQQLGNPSWGIGQFVLAPLWNKRNVALNDAALQQLELSPQDRILEIGFGGGYLLDKIVDTVTDGYIAGIDCSSAMVDVCRKRFRRKSLGNTVVLQKATAEQIPFPSSHFTKICSVNSIFYWNDVHQAFTEIRRTLDKRGKFVLCFTVKKDLENRKFAKQGLRLFDIEEIKQLLTESGFSEVESIRRKDQYRDFGCVTAWSDVKND